MPGTIAGHRLTGRTRASEVGSWHDAVAPDGSPSGVLRFDPALLAQPGGRERLVAVVSTDRRLQQSGMAGLLPIHDLVAAGGEIWLITSRRAMPTVADLLTDGGRRPDAGSAATVLVEIAQTLLSVHAAGLSHGALHPGTIIVLEDGAAQLAERGLLEALRGAPASPARDIAAWAELARVLAASWADGPAAGLFDRAASAATTQGLSAARDTLLAGRDMLPAGFTTRQALVETLHWWSMSAVPTSPAPAAPDTGELVTLLHPDGPRAAAAATVHSPANGPGGANGADDVHMRFGPGVPTETTAAQIWRSGRDQQSTVHHPERVGGRPVKQGSARTLAWSGSILVAILVAAAVILIRGCAASGPALAVSGVNVTSPKKVGCDQTATIKARVVTNGGVGSFRYVWLRSDGQKLPEQEQSVQSGAKSVDLPLHWKVTGKGTFKGTATLRVLTATSTGKPVQDKASFTYKC
ncbi:hypothetical protein J5X84_19470 [Streptosporangiaceae bacterium NEAU-GS5]|nr:hypothetical protein [Streptosporangiaceae bacterium NEAU-GS5]